MSGRKGRKNRLNKTEGGEFIGFSAFASTSTEPSSVSSGQVSERSTEGGVGGGGGGASRILPSPVYLPPQGQSNNESLTVLMKKLTKKDGTTKARAFADLKNLAFGTKTSSSSSSSLTASCTLTRPERVAVLSHVTYLVVSKLAYDNDRSVRAQAVGCLAAAAKAVPRAFASLTRTSLESFSDDKQHSSSLFTVATVVPWHGVLWCLRSDPASEVRTEARRCWEATISCEEKSRPNECRHWHRAVLSHLLFLANHATPHALAESLSATSSSSSSQSNERRKSKGTQSASSHKSSPGNTTIDREDDAEQAMEERYERVVVSALAGLVQWMEEARSLQEETESPFASPLASLSSRMPWKHMTSSSRSAVRRETYRLLSVVARPPMLLLENKDNDSAVTMHLYGALSTERDPINAILLLEALLMYLSTTPNNNSNDNSSDKVKSPPELKQLTKLLGRQGMASVSSRWAPLILPLLARWPRSQSLSLLSRVWETRAQASVVDACATASAVAESCLYLFQTFSEEQDEGLVDGWCDLFGSAASYGFTVSSSSSSSSTKAVTKDLLTCVGRGIVWTSSSLDVGTNATTRAVSTRIVDRLWGRPSDVGEEFGILGRIVSEAPTDSLGILFDAIQPKREEHDENSSSPTLTLTPRLIPSVRAVVHRVVSSSLASVHDLRFLLRVGVGSSLTELLPKEPNKDSAELFCLDRLLGWMLLRPQPRSHDNNDDNEAVALSFRLVCQCLSSLQKPGHERRVWETFLREVGGGTSFQVLAVGLDAVRTEESIPVLKCPTLEELAVKAATDASLLYHQSCDHTNDNNEEYDDNGDVAREEETETAMDDLRPFLRVCLGLDRTNRNNNNNNYNNSSKNKMYPMLLSPQTISALIDCACPPRFDDNGLVINKGSDNDDDDDNRPNVLLETLVDYVRNTHDNDGIIDTESVVRVLTEAWYQRSRVWNHNVLGLCHKQWWSSTIHDAWVSRSSQWLSDDLFQSGYDNDNDDSNNDERVRTWTERARRLFDRTTDDTTDPLTRVGLDRPELWKSSSESIPYPYVCLRGLLSFLEGYNFAKREDAVPLALRILSCLWGRDHDHHHHNDDDDNDDSTPRSFLCEVVLTGSDDDGVDSFLRRACTQVVQDLSGNDSSRNLVLTLDLLAELYLSSDPVQENDDDDTRPVVSTELRVGDTVLYVRNDDTNDTVEARIMQIHTDDFPNLYFTIAFRSDDDKDVERQTVPKRLRLRGRCESSSSSSSPTQPIIPTARQTWLEDLLFDGLVGPFLSSSPPTDFLNLDTLGRCIRLVVSQCGLSSGVVVGLASRRYAVFRFLTTLVQSVIDGLSCSSGNNDTAKVTRSILCLHLAMDGRYRRPPYHSNLEVIGLDPDASLQAVCAYFEPSTDTDGNLETTTPLSTMDVEFLCSVLLWIRTVATYACKPPRKDDDLISRCIQVVNVVTEELLRDTTSLEVIHRSVLVLTTVEQLRKQQQQQQPSASLVLDCIGHVVQRLSTQVWIHEDCDGEEKDFESDTPKWYGPLSRLMDNHDDVSLSLALTTGAESCTESLVTSLFSQCPYTASCAFSLLRSTVAMTTTTMATTDSVAVERAMARIDTGGMAVEEIDELREDVRTALRWVPDTIAIRLESDNDVDADADQPRSLRGHLLSWLILLDVLQRAGNDDARNRTAIGSYLQKLGAVDRVLDRALPVTDWKGFKKDKDKDADERLTLDSNELLDVFTASKDNNNYTRIATEVVYRTAEILPTLTKSWWNERCPRRDQATVAAFVKDCVAPKTFRTELARVTSSSTTPVLGDMSVQGSCVSREIVATYVQDECQLSVVIRVPPSFPLRNVEVDCRKTRGIAEKRWRRWSLQIMRMLNSQDGTVLDALRFWKENVDREFEGVEPCPVCYSVLCVKTHTMPNLECRTCKNRFHSTCLFKWFASSGKSQCVLCQQPWSGTKV